MKKRLAILLVFAMLAALSSCAGTEPADTLDYTTPPVSTETPAETTSDTTGATEKPELPEPTLTVTEEVDWEHNAVKITVSGDGMYYLPQIRGEYIENYRYEVGVNSSGRMQAFPLPMASPVVLYYPISAYKRDTTPTEIVKVDAAGKTYREEYSFSLDIASMLPDEPIELQDEFLHAAMTDFFGGEYSQRDLFSIGELFIDYHRLAFQSYDREPNLIQIRKESSDTPVNYYYSDFFDTPVEETPSLISDAMLEDLKLFRGLYSLLLQEKWDSGNREKYIEIMQQVATGYEVTELPRDQWGY